VRLPERAGTVPRPPPYWPGIPEVRPFEDVYDGDEVLDDLLLEVDLLTAPKKGSKQGGLSELVKAKVEAATAKAKAKTAKREAKAARSEAAEQRHEAQAERAETREVRAEGRTARAEDGGESVGAARSGMLPVMDPEHNVRETAKQLALLEDHLFHPAKRCADCIRKHLLTAEALAEEATTLDVDGAMGEATTEGLVEKIRGLQRAYLAGISKRDLAQKVREIRKDLAKRSFGAVSKQASQMPEGSRAVRDRVGPEPVEGGDPPLGVPPPMAFSQDSVDGLGGSADERPDLETAVQSARSEWLGRNGVLAVRAIGGDTIRVERAPVDAPEPPGTYMGWPVETTTIRCRPGLHRVLPLARWTLVGQYGIESVALEKNPSHRPLTLDPEYRLVALVSGRGKMPGQARIPDSYMGWPMVTRPLRARGSTARGSSALMESDAHRRGFRGGEAVIFGVPRADESGLFTWRRGHTLQVGDRFDDDLVESIPQQGWVAVRDPARNTAHWVPEAAVVRVQPSPISDWLRGRTLTRFDEKQLTGAVVSQRPLTEEQLAMADLVQGVMAPHLANACDWAGIDPALVANKGCRQDVPQKLLVAALVNAAYESNFDPEAVGDKGASVGLFQLNVRGAGQGMSVVDRKNPIRNTLRILEVASKKAPAFATAMVNDAQAAVTAPMVGAAEIGTPVGEYARLWTVHIEEPKYADKKGALRGRTADLLVAAGTRPTVATDLPVLRAGVQGQGPAVALLQQRLNAHGYPVDVDGTFGPRTLAAVIEFQLARGIVPDGVVGPSTWSALMRERGAVAPAPAPMARTAPSAPSAGPSAGVLVLGGLAAAAALLGVALSRPG
jgi:hypothetical protein